MAPGAILLIDRHSTSLRPYRKSESNMYAVLAKGKCLVRYVELTGESLVLSPHNSCALVKIIPLTSGSTHIIGRFCYVGIETCPFHARCYCSCAGSLHRSKRGLLPHVCHGRQRICRETKTSFIRPAQPAASFASETTQRL